VPQDRRDLRRRLFALASGQGGYFTAAQARTTGYSYQGQAHHVSAGNWLRIDRGIFRLVEWIPEVHDDLVRWTLWSGGRAIVSHESALAVHGVGELESPRVHLTVPPSFRMRDDAVSLHQGDLPETDVEERNGFRVTTILRSLIDVAGNSADDDQLGRAIAQARGGGRFTLRQLRERAETLDVRATLHIERALHFVEAS